MYAGTALIWEQYEMSVVLFHCNILFNVSVQNMFIYFERYGVHLIVSKLPSFGVYRVDHETNNYVVLFRKHLDYKLVL